MIHCRNCGHTEPGGALFCSECGAKLDLEKATNEIGLDTGDVDINPEDLLPAADVFPEMPEAASSPPAELAPRLILRLLDTGTEIALDEEDEYTLGRVSAGQPLIPEIDLGKFDAYEKGVSRLHAVIGLHKEKVTITDLGSANGTWVNGIRVSPHTSLELKNGDMITLGKLIIQVKMSGWGSQV